MNIKEHWSDIQDIFKNANSTSRHCAIATVNTDGSPNVTPIGSLFLRENCTGYYFEEYSQNMPSNFESNKRVCVLAVNSGMIYWIRAIFTGRFESSPGVRLHGIAGERREATEEEIASWQERVKGARKRKGHDLIWKNLRHIREIKFNSFEPVSAGKMTQHLWKDQ